MCKTPGMEGYDANFPIEKNCHCLTIGLFESCASKCLPNPYCSPSRRPNRPPTQQRCSACVEKHATHCSPSSWGDDLSCYETCQKPICIKECSPSDMCHPSDPICSDCVHRQPSCTSTVASYARPWSAGCSTACLGAACLKACNRYCGDGYRTNDEQCDDGNTISGDGCSTNCEIEPNFTCRINNNDEKRSVCEPTVCGNGVIEAGEQCDDGNLGAGDGCDPNCQLESGFSCPLGGGNPNQPCHSTCGDKITASDEQCDDGNTHSNDGCSATCETEDGYRCDGTTCHAICGDGKSLPSEACDDGNTDSKDGCSATCQIEPGFECRQSAANVKSDCEPICGDGKSLGAEACDDGNTDSKDGCSAVCEVESGWTCTTSSSDDGKSTCVLDQVCGNGVRQSASKEQCDDGNTASNDGCDAKCQIEDGYTCVENHHGLSTCSRESQVAECGNGKLESEEQQEQCDDGNTDSNDGCSANCQIEPGYECKGSGAGSCSLAIACGNGVVQAEEECDTTRAGCDSSTCKSQPGFTCVDNSCHSNCGDGIKTSQEECDDGNTVPKDGCDAECRIEKGFQCWINTSSSSSSSACVAICGDGIYQAGHEECDDGNADSNDGCSSDCLLEPGYTCHAKEDCTRVESVCGDGIQVEAAAEQCDDGNTAPNDGCDAECRVENGFTCTSSSNGHRSTCSRRPICGNGQLEPGEFCDDGNTASNDGCSQRCVIEFGYECPSPNSACRTTQCSNVRRDWNQYSPHDKRVFQSCVNQAFQYELYQKFIGIHVFRVNDEYAHYTNGFVAWHRKWLVALENMLRSLGGECVCVTLPYWDWTEEAARRQVNGCSTKEECSPVMRDWGGGGSVDSDYRTIPVWNAPDATQPVDTGSGYCVLNDITKDWRANSILGAKYIHSFNASCPIIRRGWNDRRDGNYANPMVGTSFLSLASNIGRSRTYAEFAPILNGDIHILPHDNSGGLLLTFMSPADPLFILHHTNIDRIWALWAKCHGCDTITPAMRAQNSQCYTATRFQDQVSQRMPFQYFQPSGEREFQLMEADDASDFVEWWPKGLVTPGDVLSTTSLGPYSYIYGADELDGELLRAGRCRSSTSADGGGFVLLSAQSSDTATTDEELLEYVHWVRAVLMKATDIVTALNQLEIFDLSWLQSASHDLSLEVTDIAATCECMHSIEHLNNKSSTLQALADISASTKRMWNSEMKFPNCFQRITNTQDLKRVRERQYCRVILSDSFAESLASLLDWLKQVLFQDNQDDGGGLIKTTLDFAKEYFQK